MTVAKLVMKGQAVEDLAAFRKERAELRKVAERYKTEIERANNMLADGLAGPRSGRDDAFPNEDRWPSYEDILSIWGQLVDVERRIGNVERQLREWGALD